MLNGFILIIFILIASIEVEFSLGKVFTTGLDAPVTANLITLKIWLYLPIATIADISWVFIY